MNKGIIFKCIKVLIILGLIFPGWVQAQKNQLSFENERLDIVLKMIEDNSEYVFNYDPNLLTPYYFTGNLDLSNNDQFINKILYDTPLEFTINQTAIIIFMPELSDYRICGYLKDNKTQEVLIGANIFLNNTTQGTLTNNIGYFDFTIKSYKNQNVSFSYIGYETLELQVQSFNQIECSNIQMYEDTRLLGEGIVITDFILDGITEEIEFNGFIMDYSKLSKQHSMIEHDILKTAQFLPGISSLDESATNLQIRGGTSDQNLILWEGIPIYQPGHIFGMISAINPFSIQNVEIHQGVYDPQYDNRVGGIIDISLSDSLQSKGSGSIGTSLTEAHINVETPVLFKKLKIFLSGRNSISDLYYSPPLENYTNKVFQLSKIDDNNPGIEEGFNIVDQRINFHDWNAKILYEPIENILISAAYYKNDQVFQYNLSFPEDPYNTKDNLRASSEAVKIKVNWNINNKLTSSISFVQSTYENAYNFEAEELGDTLATYNQFNDIIDNNFIISSSYKTPIFQFNAGYDFNVKKLNFNIVNKNINEPIFEDFDNEKGTFHNFYASTNFNYKDIHVSGGLRSTYFAQQDRWYQSPRISMQYFITKKLKLKSEAGIFHQFISQLEEIDANTIQVESPLWVLNSREGTSSQKARKIAFGMNYIDKNWLFDIEGYFNITTGLTTLSPTFEVIPTLEFSTGESEVLGISVIIKRRWKNLDTWVNYSFNRNNYNFYELFQPKFTSPNEIRHNVNFTGSYTYKQLQLSLIGNYRSGIPFSRADGVLEIYDEDDNEYFYLVHFESINNDRLKDYARVDLSINYRPSFEILGKSKVELSLSMINVLNRVNVFDRGYYLDYPNNGGEPELSFVDRTLLPRTPLFLCRMYW